MKNLLKNISIFVIALSTLQIWAAPIPGLCFELSTFLAVLETAQRQLETAEDTLIESHESTAALAYVRAFIYQLDHDIDATKRGQSNLSGENLTNLPYHAYVILRPEMPYEIWQLWLHRWSVDTVDTFIEQLTVFEQQEVAQGARCKQAEALRELLRALFPRLGDHPEPAIFLVTILRHFIDEFMRPLAEDPAYESVYHSYRVADAIANANGNTLSDLQRQNLARRWSLLCVWQVVDLMRAHLGEQAPTRQDFDNRYRHYQLYLQQVRHLCWPTFDEARRIIERVRVMGEQPSADNRMRALYWFDVLNEAEGRSVMLPPEESNILLIPRDGTYRPQLPNHGEVFPEGDYAAIHEVRAVLEQMHMPTLQPRGLPRPVIMPDRNTTAPVDDQFQAPPAPRKKKIGTLIQNRNNIRAQRLNLNDEQEETLPSEEANPLEVLPEEDMLDQNRTATVDEQIQAPPAPPREEIVILIQNQNNILTQGLNFDDELEETQEGVETQSTESRKRKLKNQGNGSDQPRKRFKNKKNADDELLEKLNGVSRNKKDDDEEDQDPSNGKGSFLRNVFAALDSLV